VHVDEAGNKIRTWPVDSELQDTAEHNPADDGHKHEYGRAARSVELRKASNIARSKARVSPCNPHELGKEQHASGDYENRDEGSRLKAGQKT
jgi:hypothetical protein